jgi:prepilin-type N-terminal cleavage/methylation domain-containing protein
MRHRGLLASRLAHGLAYRLPVPPHRKSGFSLVELLVVMAIVISLVGLLLPSVQAARESGRRTQCSNNLRQLALGCQQHLDAQSHFPTGGWGREWGGDPDAGFGIQQPGGWHYAVLPFIDQMNLRQDGSGSDAAGKAMAGKRTFETHVAGFVCPTRGVSEPVQVGAFPYENIAPPSIAGRSDYAANGGDATSATMMAQDVVAGSTPQATARSVLAFPGSAQGDAAGNDRATGVIFRGSVMRAAHLPDGLTNVYLVGERFIEHGQSRTSAAAGNRQGWLVGFGDDSIRFTADPPETDKVESLGVYEPRFGGPHSSAFPMAMADGSVQMIPYDIDPETHKRLGNRKDGEIASVSSL